MAGKGFTPIGQVKARQTLPHAPATMGGEGALPSLNQLIAGSRLGVGPTRVPGKKAVAAANKSIFQPRPKPQQNIYELSGAPPAVTTRARAHAAGKAVPPPTPTSLPGSAFDLPKFLARAVYEPVVQGARHLPHDVASGDLLSSALDTLGIASVIPPLRGVRAVSEGAKAYRAADEGMKALAATRAAGESYAAGKGVIVPALKAGGSKVRSLRYNELTQQLPRSRSVVARSVAHVADAASVKLQPHLHDVPGARIVTAGERVAKGAGRAQRVEGSRAIAQVSEHLNALDKLKSGSDEDIAHFWYAQLPAKYRNAEGLLRVRAKQDEELRRITSGQALEDLNKQESAVKAQMGKAEGNDKLAYLRDLEEVKVHKTDLPQRAEDISASIGKLGKIAEKAPQVRPEVLKAASHLSSERQRILTESGKLQPERAAERTGLVSRWLGLNPSGEEIYVGHRLPKAESGRGNFMPTGGTGKVRTPQGVATENRLVLAKTGRVLPSLHASARDWQAARQFEQSNVDRELLAKMGTPFAGHVPTGHVLVNPRGRTIPAHWRSDELAQFSADTADQALTREQAKEILGGFIAETPADFEKMKTDAVAQGVKWDELRTVSKRLVDRYYSQFRPAAGRGAMAKGYDTAVDAVATSIIFGRIGYIPKNFVQNLVMAVPHQGALLLTNAARAGQVLADPELRHLLQAEIGHTGATGALAREGFHMGKIAGGVSKIADDPIRVSAFLHEAAAEGVISRVNPLLGERDRSRLLHLLKDESNRPLLNDIRSRAVEAMADFSRMTPDQARIARRFLIIPGWLMAGTRYPFHFAVNHPARSALLAYIAMGEPGAPDNLHFNQPVSSYMTKGVPAWLDGIKIGNKVLRTGSISPVNTPWDLGKEVVQTFRGKTSPYSHVQTTFDSANPLLGSGVRFAQGEGFKRSAAPLAPNLKLALDLIHPHASPSYPGDATRLGRLAREVGVIPIPENESGASGSSSGGFVPIGEVRASSLLRSGSSSGGSNSLLRSGDGIFTPRSSSLLRK
jgi:hypothetical protein